MRLLAISDIHIKDERDPLYASTIRLIESTQKGDVLVLGGDIFELFVGKKQVFLERFSKFLAAVRAACHRAVEVHYIEGNHDFQLKEVYGDIPGVQLHELEFSKEINGKRFYFAHGDLADRRDYGYRFLRGFFRSLPFRAFVKVAPDRWIEAIGAGLGDQSRMGRPKSVMDYPGEKLEKLRTTYRNFAAEKVRQGFDFVVLGHCHDLDQKVFQIDGRKCQYINIGFPRIHGSFISWSPGADWIEREALR